MGQVLENSGENADLVNAIRRGDLEAVRRLLAAGRNPGTPGYRGERPLVAACEVGNLAMVDLLLAQGADPEAADLFDHTPLMYAAASGDTAVVVRLLRRGANVNRAIRSEPPVTEGEQGMTALFFACKRGALEVAKVLVAEGAALDHRVADTIIRRDGPTPCLRAAEAGHEAIVEFLLRAGAADPPQEVRAALLRGAAGNGDTLLVARLLGEGVAADARFAPTPSRPGGYAPTPLMRAIRSEPSVPDPAVDAVVRLLIGAGANVDDALSGETPLVMALQQSRLEVFRMLLARGADPDRKAKWSDSARKTARREARSAPERMQPYLLLMEQTPRRR